MDTALTFILLLRCWSVWSLPRGQSVSFNVVFSDGTQLLVDVTEEHLHHHLHHHHHHHHHHHLHHHENRTTGVFAGSAPSIQVLASVPPSPPLLVCLLTGLNSPAQDILWWVDDMLVTSSDAKVSWMWSEGGGAYSATSVWELSAAEWRSRSTYWCGTVQEAQVYRQRVCSEDGL